MKIVSVHYYKAVIAVGVRLIDERIQIRIFALFFGLLGLVTSGQAQTINPSYETVSECFFAYAAITETGRDSPHPQLLQFGQARLGWAGGYFQANQSNAVFKQVFESGLQGNKRMAIQLQSSMKQAITSCNKSQFVRLMDQALECDRKMGIRTEPMPMM